MLGRHVAAYSAVHDSDEASDIVQEVFIRLWDNRYELANMRNIRSYCMTAVRNQSIDCKRRRTARYSEPLDIHTDLKEAQASPQERIEQSESLRVVEKFIESLPEDQQTVIRLNAYDGCSNEEIRQITGLSPENVRTLLSRGRRKLRELFRNHIQ